MPLSITPRSGREITVDVMFFLKDANMLYGMLKLCTASPPTMLSGESRGLILKFLPYCFIGTVL